MQRFVKLDAAEGRSLYGGKAGKRTDLTRIFTDGNSNLHGQCGEGDGSYHHTPRCSMVLVVRGGEWGADGIVSVKVEQENIRWYDGMA